MLVVKIETQPIISIIINQTNIDCCWFIQGPAVVDDISWILEVPSGKHTKSYWKLPFIVDLPIKNCDFP